MVPCVSIDWRNLQRAAAHLLPALFIPLAALNAVASVAAGWLGTDAYLYYRASAAWLAGGSPWNVFVTNQESVYHYQALPTATVVLAPFTVIPENAFVAGWIVIQFLAAVYTVRRLGLPWWWVAFPPLISGVLAGNPSPLLIALLVAAHPIAKSLAVLLKVYAVVPLLGERRWRAIMMAVGLALVTVLLAPGLWVEFLAGSGARTELVLRESKGGFSAFGNPILLLGAGAALVVIARRDLRVAGWLAPIALWPGSQFHWSTLAMPVMTLPMAYLLALPAHGIPPVAVMVYALVGEVRSFRERRGDGSPSPHQASD